MNIILDSKIKLSRMSSSHSRLRTSEVIGYVKKVPQIGSNLIITGEPLDTTKNFRWVETSEIKSFDWMCENIWKMETQNSVYEIELLEY